MEWNNIFETAMTTLIPGIIAILGTVLTYLGTKIKIAYETKVKNETVKMVIETSVSYVEQVFKDIHGAEKLERAREIIIDRLADKNITITNAAIDYLIESFVNGLGG